MGRVLTHRFGVSHFQSTTSRVFDFILAAAKEVEVGFHKTLTKKVTCILDLGRIWLLSVAHCLRPAPCVQGSRRCNDMMAQIHERELRETTFSRNIMLNSHSKIDMLV